MEKLSFQQLCAKINAHNKEHGIKKQYEDTNPLQCVIVYTKDSFKNEYDEVSRSYEFRSDEKYFLSSMGGNSIFGNCLDGKDNGVRLDWYFGEWKIEYCYIKEEK